MRTITFVLPLSLLLVVPACGGKSVDSEPGPDASTIVPSDGQRILFEWSHVNFAWQATVRGGFITSEGEVFQYDYFDSQPDAAAPQTRPYAGMIEAQLSAKYGLKPALLTTVDKETLLAKFAMIEGARSGTLLSQTMCADYGDTSFYGYLFDSESGTYTPVLLGRNGDMAVRNTAPQGQELMEWIRSLAGETGEASCAFQVQICGKPLCPDAGPCGENLIPAALEGEQCAAYCAAPSSCREVASCSDCNPYSPVCVIDQAGKHHCLSWYIGCESLESTSCECGGAQVCAGGRDLCRGNLESGFSCAAP